MRSILIASFLIIDIVVSSLRLPSPIRHALKDIHRKTNSTSSSKNEKIRNGETKPNSPEARNNIVSNFSKLECSTIQEVNYTADVNRIYDRPVQNELFYIYMPSIEAQILDFTLNGSHFDLAYSNDIQEQQEHLI